MKYILGTKLNMTQVFTEDGQVIPATVVALGPVVVTQVKDKEKDGYRAMQVGFGSRNPNRMNKSMKGHVKDLGSFRILKEFRLEDSHPEVKVGDSIKADTFAPGDAVTVSAISKGKGFQGVVKRHGFGGGRRTHGQKHSEREPGSIGGAGRAGGRVAKGMRMAGRMGGDRITIRGLKIVQVDAENNTALISGALPGRRGTLVEVIGA